MVAVGQMRWQRNRRRHRLATEDALVSISWRKGKAAPGVMLLRPRVVDRLGTHSEGRADSPSDPTPSRQGLSTGRKESRAPREALSPSVCCFPVSLDLMISHPSSSFQ